MSINPLARTLSAALALAFLVACGSGYDGGTPLATPPLPGIAAALPAQCVTIRGGTAADPEVIPVSLSGRFEVPPTVALGTGNGALTINRTTGELSGSMTVTALSGPATAAHLHTGFAGINDAILLTLAADNAVPGKFDVPAGTLLAAADLATLAAGGMYVNVHTTANPDGEIRGQLVSGGIDLVRCDLSGDFAVPAVGTTGLGVGYATVDTVGGKLVANLRTSGISNATEAHVHRAAAGLNSAAILLPLIQTGGAGTELWEASGTLSGLDLSGYLAGELYLDVHTPANPNGLIRSQLVPKDISVLRFVLAGSQEVPPVTTTATAVAYTTVHVVSGALAANARTSNLAGANGAHLHQAAIGVNGPITVPLVQPDVALTPELWAASATFTAPQLTAFLASQTYLNVHSASFPEGEIRGQIIQP